MKKKYLPLTDEQKERGVIFSSQLIGGSCTHEVFNDTPQKNTVINRLLDDSFFNSSHYKYNLIRQ